MAKSPFSSNKPSVASEGDFDVISGASLPPDLRKLRHLGFRRILLSGDLEHYSFGPSYFHQLGYCAHGNVSLIVFGDYQPRQSFDLQMGDIFFLPAGSQFVVENAKAESANLVIASARDNFDIFSKLEAALPLALPTRPSAGPLLQTRSTEPCEIGQKAGHQPSWDMEDDSPHVVLFFDPPGTSGEHEDTIAGLFSREVLAREFGMSEAALPEFGFGLHDALVIRPVDPDPRATN